MVEVALDGAAHGVLITPTSSRCVAAFAEVGEVEHQQDAHGVCVVEQQRVIDLDVDAQEIEPTPFGVGDVVAQAAGVSRRVHPLRIERLVERAAQVHRLVVQAQGGGCCVVVVVIAEHRCGADLAQAKVRLHLV